MSALDRKLLRDLRRLGGQVLAIALVVACAVAAQIAASSTARSLGAAVDGTYARQRFPDVFASLHRAPDTLEGRLAAIPGVAVVEPRIATDAAVELAGVTEPLRAQVVSLPADGRAPELSVPQLRLGRTLAAGAADEALVSPGFFQAHRLRLGDRIDVILDGRRQGFRIVGVALSPEFIYPVRPGELVPDEARNGVLYVSRDALAAALDLRGGFNAVALRLAAGAPARAVIDEVDRLLEPYGGLGAHGRDRHGSARFLSDKVEQLQEQATTAPLLFFGVAAYLLGFLLSRLVANDRVSIGTLRALGFTRREVGAHYAKLALAVVAVGALLGVPLGAVLGAGLTAQYAGIFRLPEVPYLLGPGSIAGAVAASVVFGLLGAATAVRRAARLAPAEAMRPPPPASFRRTAIEAWLGPMLPLTGRMALRNLGRRPLRAALTVLGIAAAGATVIAGAFFFDSFQRVLEVQFGLAARHGVTVTLTDARDPSALSELAHLPGVVRAEPFRAVSAVVRHAGEDREVTVLGLGARPELIRPVGGAGGVASVPPGGLLVSSRLAEGLGVSAGDEVELSLREGSRPRRTVRVTGLVDDLVGTAAYADLRTLGQWLGEGPRISGAYLALAGADGGDLYGRLRAFPRVAGATVKAAEVATFRRTSGSLVLLFAGLFTAFGAVLASGVVYNAARASFAERERELATLRLIGFTRREVTAVSLTEVAVLVLLALPVGALLGRGFAGLLAASTRTDILRLPVVVNPGTYAFAAALVVAATVLVGLRVRRWVGRLAMVDALKSKE